MGPLVRSRNRQVRGVVGRPPMGAPGPSRRSLIGLALVVGAMLVAGCVEDEQRSLEARATVEGDWIAIELIEGPEAPYTPAGEAEPPYTDVVRTHVSPPGEEGSYLFICETPEDGLLGCADDFAGDDRWEVGEKLWLPCQAEGSHRVVVLTDLDGVAALDEVVSCEEAVRDRPPGEEPTGADDRPTSDAASVSADRIDLDDDGGDDWVKFELVRGEEAPYPARDVNASTVDPDGDEHGFLCVRATTLGCQGTSSEFRAEDGDEWEEGGTLWFPCQGEGVHRFTIALQGSTVRRVKVHCDQAA